MREKEESSISRKLLRLIQRIILGTGKPPIFLRLISVIALSWDFIMFMLFIILAVFSLLGEDVLKAYKMEEFMRGSKFLFTYAHLHLFSFVAVAMMWRRKLWGFYLYIIMNLLMPVLTFLMLKETFPFESLIFAGAMIGLFAINIPVFKKANVSDEEL
ncbi:MAG: hypothetical protein ACK4K0_08595 [Flavobacteriales bacterium]